MPRASLLNVPYTGLREVEIQAPPNAQQQIKVSDEMFGSQVGAALKNFGGTLESLGATFGAMEEKNKHELEQTKAREIDTQMIKDYTKLDTEYQLQNGKQAVDSWENNDKAREEIKANALKSAGGNKRIERMVSASAESHLRRSWVTSWKHKEGESITYGNEVSENRVNAAGNKAATSKDPEDLKSAFSVIDNEYGEIAKRSRWSPEQLEVKANEKRATVLTQFINNIAKDDPDVAQKYFEDNKEVLKLHKPSFDAAEKSISAGFAGKSTADRARELLNGDPVRAPERRPLDPRPTPSVGPLPLRVPLPGTPRTEAPKEEKKVAAAGHLEEADKELKLTPQEKNLYSTHLKNLNGPGGVDNPPDKDNPKGSRSTLFVSTFEVDGKTYAVPTVWDGKKHTPDEALARAKKDGLDKYPSYASQEEAKKRYDDMHGFMEKDTSDYYASKAKTETKPETKPAKPGEAPDRHKVTEREYPPDSTEISAARRTYAVGPTGTPNHAIPGYPVGSAEVEHYVVNAARARGIDAGTALRVYFSEGSTDYKSGIRGEDSWGPFQLYTGGGLGNEFIAAGHGNPADPKNWQATVDFALNKVVEGGWGPWNGAKAVGITGRQGVANDARQIKVGEDIHKEEPADFEEESDKPIPLKDRSVMAYSKAQQTGDLTVKPKEGSRVIYAQKGHIRGLDLHSKLSGALEDAAAASGVFIRVTSGGQTSDRNPARKDQPGGWTGSHRHDDGRAADIDILDENGRNITDRNDPRRLKFLEEAAARGAGGTGTGYMSDNLKVHVGITGASGEIGQGLGVYSRQSTSAELAAVERGLAKAGIQPSIARGGGSDSMDGTGRIRLAAVHQTGATMSDAPPIGGEAGTRFAQATSSASRPPQTSGPLTAQSTDADLEARIKKMKDEVRALGHDESYADNIATQARSQFATMKKTENEITNNARDEMQRLVYGDGKEAGITNFSDITDDPKKLEKFQRLPGHEQDTLRKHIIGNSNEKWGPVSAEQLDNWDNLVANAPHDPSMLENVDMSKIHPQLRARVMKLRDDIMKGGGASTIEAQRVDKILSSPDVEFQLRRAGLFEKDDKGKEVETADYKEFRAKFTGQLRYWFEANPGKGGPKQEDINLMVNGLLRKIAQPPEKTWYGGTREVPARPIFKTPLSAQENNQVVNQWNERNPFRQVESVDDIPPEAVWHWRNSVNKRTKSWQP
jgi:hypothetical protein